MPGAQDLGGLQPDRDHIGVGTRNFRKFRPVFFEENGWPLDLARGPVKNPCMSTGRLTIDLDAIAANWRALDGMSGETVQTAAVVKADAYGLGVAKVGRSLAAAGARRFFVAVAEEGAELREALGREAGDLRLCRPYGWRYRDDPRSRPGADAQFHRPAHPPFRGAAGPSRFGYAARYRHEPARAWNQPNGRRWPSFALGPDARR